MPSEDDRFIDCPDCHRRLRAVCVSRYDGRYWQSTCKCGYVLNERIDHNAETQRRLRAGQPISIGRC